MTLGKDIRDPIISALEKVCDYLNNVDDIKYTDVQTYETNRSLRLYRDKTMYLFSSGKPSDLGFEEGFWHSIFVNTYYGDVHLQTLTREDNLFFDADYGGNQNGS